MCAALWVLAVLLLTPASALAQANGQLQIHHIRVGQGDAALIVSPLGETMLIDSGPESASACASSTGIITYLAEIGLSRARLPRRDLSGKLDVDGHPVLLGKHIEVDQTQAEIIRRIFEWVAQGAGLSTVVKRLNAEGIPGTRGKRWSKGAVQGVLNNERYRGLQIWGQQYVEHVPGTGRRIKRANPREQWHVVERPELRIVSDELWTRIHSTRAEIRAAVAPKGKSLARGKSGKHHSQHLFSGFARSGVCGGAMSSVSGGKGSPRFGCRRSWQEGHACPNRLTICIKVEEPQKMDQLTQFLKVIRARHRHFFRR